MSLGEVDWKLLKGLENRKTPISDFLYDIFQREAVDIIMSSTDAEELFDRAEALITLEAAHCRLQATEPRGWFWVPYGRYVWRSQGGGVNRRFVEFEQLTAGSPVLKAGLLGGSPESAANAVAAVRDFFKELGGSLFR
jgi:hypothetical protein